MTTQIISNGSKWMGEEPDNLDSLFKMLETFPLRRDFGFSYFVQEHPIYVSQSWRDEYEGKNIAHYVASVEQPPAGQVHFGGNFYGYSHVFSIKTDEPELIKRLKDAIIENMKRPDFLAQPEPEPDEPYVILWQDGHKEYFKP